VLIIGFGRFAQVASQGLLARGIDVTIIENDTEMIRSAAEFGFKVYYGDGTRLDVLRTSGAEQVQAILVCVDDRSACDRIVTLVKSEFPHAKLYVRAFDRSHAIELIGAGVDGQVLESLGATAQETADILEDVRRRDAERMRLEITGGMYAGRELLRGNIAKPTPFTPPKRTARPLSEETADVIETMSTEPAGS
jgi:glutathione-regulated potassium-efflux system protein KefB